MSNAQARHNFPMLQARLAPHPYFCFICVRLGCDFLLGLPGRTFRILKIYTKYCGGNLYRIPYNI